MRQQLLAHPIDLPLLTHLDGQPLRSLLRIGRRALGIGVVLFPFFQAVLGWSGLLPTVAMMPMALAMMMSSGLAPKLAAGIGARMTTVAGIALAGVGMALMALLVSVSGGYLSVLPGLHGDAVCRRLVQRGVSRVLMLTASDAVEDRVGGLMLGADDYLGKPFAFSELVARVHALIWRSAPARPPVLRAAGVTLDLARRSAERDGRLLRLTPKEFGVLEQLLAASGDVVSAETLLDKVWDEHADPFTNAVRITVGTLRRKLGDPPLIETVTGAGYRIGG
nr:winged helix-turn-helix domain-containing protein [Nonomuraea sp. ATCC 55076]